MIMTHTTEDATMTLKIIHVNGTEIDRTSRATALFVHIATGNEYTAHGFSIRYSKSITSLQNQRDADTVIIAPITTGVNDFEV